MLLKVRHFRTPVEFRPDHERTEVWEKLRRRIRLHAKSTQCRVEKGRLCGDTRVDTASTRSSVSVRRAPQTTACGPPPRPTATYWHPPLARACGTDRAQTQQRRCYPGW